MKMEAQAVTLTRRVIGVRTPQIWAKVYCTNAEDLEIACEDEADQLYEQFPGKACSVSGSMFYPSRGGQKYGTVRVSVEVTRKGYEKTP